MPPVPTFFAVVVVLAAPPSRNSAAMPTPLSSSNTCATVTPD
jgi:hypothetical protein